VGYDTTAREIMAGIADHRIGIDDAIEFICVHERLRMCPVGNGRWQIVSEMDMDGRDETTHEHQDD
jgi:hypothetical protein